MNTLKELLALGFTPAAALAIVATVVLWFRMESKDRRNKSTREEWHAATLARVEIVEAHSEECNKDRERLKDTNTALATQVAVLDERTKRLATCPKSGCPNRLPG